MIDIALLGFGQNGWDHLNLLKIHPLLRGRARIVGVFDPSPDVQKKVRAKGLKIFPTVDDAIDTADAEAEYLHDVSYRWFQGGHVEQSTPRRESWYSQFDPLAYAYAIGPAQVGLGGLEHPAPFIKVSSYANDLGGENGAPICRPSHSFHVDLFKTPTGAIAKCASAFVIAREPLRMGIQVVGELGTYEAPSYGKRGRLFLADDHVITHRHHRAGRAMTIGRWQQQKVKSPGIQKEVSAAVRVVNDWLTAIEKDTMPHLHARVGGNMCMADIAASQAARNCKIVDIPTYE